MKAIVFVASIAFYSAGLIAADEHDHEHSAEEHAKHSPAPSAQEPIPGEHGHGEMAAMYGPYSASRESSGTSWQPDASPVTGLHSRFGEWSTMLHGFANFIYDDQGGPRGDTKTFMTSMLMGMASRPVGSSGTLGLRGMVSADPYFGKGGYPLLLQTGETADGVNPLIDRQHPHDLFMELSVSYSQRL